MKVRFGKWVAVLVAVAFLTSCSTWQKQSRTTKGAATGTAAGAAAGAAIGAAAGGGQGAWKGAVIGAVVGGIAGGLIGKYMEKQAKEMEAILAEQDSLRIEQEQIHVAMAGDVLFETGKAYLQPGARDKLSRFAGVLKRYHRTEIEVIGHADSRGTEEFNYDLSLQRATAVADELASNGVSRSRIRTRGEGESRPIASNETAEGRAMNRRVEINVTPDQGLRAEQASADQAPQ
jgi:outer membrane protein OmpA-like peptidoglycan-associated protein